MKWTSDRDHTFYCPWLINSECEWGSVRFGWLTIYKGYAWDGCTPKFHWGPLSFGVWDGPINPDTGEQWCYFASMVHDFLYEYELGMRWQADKIFHSMLKGFKLQRVYYRAVRLFGRKW